MRFIGADRPIAGLLGSLRRHPSRSHSRERRAVTPITRAPVVGVYRFWRDTGYALGAIIAGTVADALGYGGAIALVGGLTAASGLWVLGDMPAQPHARPLHRPQPDEETGRTAVLTGIGR